MSPGDKVSHYEIMDRLGEGGMGIVWRARDTKLGRIVALKFLPPHLAADERIKSRFVKEASTASSLQHPNICTIYEIGETEDGRLFIAMALYEGATLREEIDLQEEGAKIDTAKAVELIGQVADGVQAAHDLGIVHRDLKPENILITRERPVVLDFGVAKLAGATQLTKDGATPGTIAYMAPEQARGEVVDHRADIWALGVVLFEMLAGRRPFRGDFDQAVLYSILNEEPAGTSSIPAVIRPVVLRALEKDPESRYQSLREMKSAMVATTLGKPSTKPRFRFVHAAGLLLFAAALAVVWMFAANLGDEASPAASTAPGTSRVFRQLTFDKAVEEFPAFSTDGRQLVFSKDVGGFRQLFVRAIESGTERQLTSEARDHIQATWSPDGASIAFVKAKEANGKLEPGDVYGLYVDGDIWKLELESGRSRLIAADAYSPSFSPDGAALALDADWGGARRIWISDEEGRNPQQLTTDISEDVDHISPRWSPDASRVVYQNIQRTVFDIHTVGVQDRTTTVVTDDPHQDVNPVFSADGSVIYFSSYRSGGMNIWAIPVNSTGQAIGPPDQVSTGAGSDVQIAVSPRASAIAYSVLGINADLWRLPIDPKTGLPTGDPVALISTTREDSRGDWSHDNERVAFNSDRTGDMNIWAYSIRDSSVKQVTSGPGGDYQPHWSPDDGALVFFSSRAGNPDIWTVDVESGALQQLTDSPRLDINPSFSPDGQKIAFQSDRDGRQEVWVMNADGSDQRALTSIGVGGHFIRWLADGSRVIFKSSDILYQVSPEGGEVSEYLRGVAGGSHISMDPTQSYVADVSGHKTVWISPLDGEPYVSFEFAALDNRIDYPSLSKDGRWLLFDRVKPQGADIWMLEWSTPAGE